MDLKELIRNSRKQVQRIKHIKYIERNKDESDEDYYNRLIDIKGKLEYYKDKNRSLESASLVNTGLIATIAFIPFGTGIINNINGNNIAKVSILMYAINIYFILIGMLLLHITYCILKKNKQNKKNSEINFVLHKINSKLNELGKYI